MASVKMPYGKYRGKRLISIPSEYFTWLLEKSEDLDAALRLAVELEMDRRGEAIPEKPTEPAPAKAAKPAKTTPEPAQTAVEIKPVSALGQRLAGDVRMLFRNLALKYHPDRGGSHDAMQALNDLHDQVQEVLVRTFSA